MNTSQLAQCEGKAAFESIGVANQVARRRKRRGVPGKPYKCPHCGEYHIGHTRPIHRRLRRTFRRY